MPSTDKRTDWFNFYLLLLKLYTSTNTYLSFDRGGVCVCVCVNNSVKPGKDNFLFKTY